jgi:NADP-dependent 3-hydroxy acid dehydrogenase YdfG
MSKIILITGASTGFGRDTAITLADEKHTVFASMRDPLGKNNQHASELTAKGVHVLELDVTDQQSITLAVDVIKEKSGGVDVLINNAGVASAGITEAFSTEQMTALFDVNVFGLHRVTRSVLPLMRAQGDGLIINIGSILGRVTFPFFGMYGASKYAVEALTDSLRYEVSQFGVDVVLVQPSAYPTQMYDSVIQPVDTDCTESYGSIGDIPGAMFEHFMSAFESADAPNPHDVAKAIVNLIDTPKGERGIRTVVGNSFGADTINDAVIPVQGTVIKALGLNHLDTVKTV